MGSNRDFWLIGEYPTTVEFVEIDCPFKSQRLEIDTSTHSAYPLTRTPTKPQLADSLFL